MDKIKKYIEERELTLERTPAKPKKANNTTLQATSSTASKEGAPSTQPAAINAKKADENQQGKSK